MIYCCEGCGFLFQRVGEVLACPVCEGQRLRYAAPEERERLEALLKTRMGKDGSSAAGQYNTSLQRVRGPAAAVK